MTPRRRAARRAKRAKPIDGVFGRTKTPHRVKSRRARRRRRGLIHFQAYLARFMPRRRDDLRPGVAEYIGRCGLFRTGWLITAEDETPYTGEWAMLTPEGWPCAWVPLLDLQLVSDTSRERRFALIQAAWTSFVRQCEASCEPEAKRG